MLHSLIEFLELNLRAKICVMCVVPPAIVTLEAGVFLEALRDLIKSRTLHSAHGQIGD